MAPGVVVNEQLALFARGHHLVKQQTTNQRNSESLTEFLKNHFFVLAVVYVFHCCYT